MLFPQLGGLKCLLCLSERFVNALNFGWQALQEKNPSFEFFFQNEVVVRLCLIVQASQETALDYEHVCGLLAFHLKRQVELASQGSGILMNQSPILQVSFAHSVAAHCFVLGSEDARTRRSFWAHLTRLEQLVGQQQVSQEQMLSVFVRQRRQVAARQK